MLIITCYFLFQDSLDLETELRQLSETQRISYVMFVKENKSLVGSICCSLDIYIKTHIHVQLYIYSIISSLCDYHYL